jgi:hypothetical protein
MGEGDADADSDAAPEATEAAVPERPKKKQKTSL